MTWSGRCRRDRRAIAVGLVLVATSTSTWTTAGEVAATMAGAAGGRLSPGGLDVAGPAAATPGRAALAAAAIADGLPPDVADRLRVDHLGYRRRPLETPTERPALTSDAGGMDPLELEAIAWQGIAADLAAVAASRTLEPPAPSSPEARTVTDRSRFESDELVAGEANERANLADGPDGR